LTPAEKRAKRGQDRLKRFRQRLEGFSSNVNLGKKIKITREAKERCFAAW
jgi:hypothetical protein